jgi:hypothetical protein
MKPAHSANKKKLPVFNYLLVSVCLFFMMPVANAQDYPKCTRDHPGRASRIESIAKHGDARMLLSCAGHTLKYAIARYSLQDMYNEAGVDADANGILHEMYQNLKSSSLTPFYGAQTFIDWGYQYFDYEAPQAAGILLGIYGVHNTKGRLIIPTFFQTYLELKLGIKTAPEITYFFTHDYMGISTKDATLLGTLVATELTKAAGDRKDVYIPTESYLYDVLIEDAIKAKRLYGNAYTPTPDTRDAIDTIPTTEPDAPMDTVPSANKCQALLNQCEARNRELEEKIKQLESKGGANNEIPAATPIEGGYESIYLKVTAENVEIQVKVNGRLVATYNASTTVYLDPFLKQNSQNTISFIFSGVPKRFGSVDLDGKFPSNEKWVDIYNFSPKEGKLEGKFEIPFAGKKN